MIRSSIETPCPVCDRTKDKDCSWYPNQTTVMCKTYCDGTGHDESKWHYNGINELGFQGKFILKADKEFVKPVRPKSRTDYYYPDRDGENLVKVTRIDDGQGKKNFYQYHWDTRNWVKGNPDEIKPLIPIYRYTEIRRAIERNELIFVVEGEATADALWNLGIAATTTIGGSGGYERYGNYLEDLKDAHLVLCPDRDAMGLKYMSNFEAKRAVFGGRDFPAEIEGWYLAGTAGLWKTPQGGMDIFDDIRDNSYTKEQILDRIITPSEFQETIEAGAESNSEDKKIAQPRFETNWDDGLEFVTTEVHDDKVKVRRKLIGYHLKAVAYVENPCSCGTGLLIEFRTQRGRLRQELITRSAMMGDGIEVLRLLADRGYWFDLSFKSILKKYLFHLGDTVDRIYTITEKTGWVNESYVTPAKTYGDPNLRFREPFHDFSITEIKGDLAGWIGEVAAKCGRNSRLIFSLGIAFAAPLLEPTEIESGGFHFKGITSIGKTSSLKVAASVAGVKNIPTWRSTSNALEGKAAEFNHALLPLDELGQSDPQSVGASAYMLGNGQGKSRMAKTLNTIKPKTWQLLFLSTGEDNMVDYLRQAKISVKGGMEVRMPSLPADAGKGFGAFEELHDHESPEEFVKSLETAIKKYQGTALDEYLTKLVEARKVENFDKDLRDRVHQIARKLSKQFNDSMIGRVAIRFALVQVGLEVAHSYDLLPFPIEQCAWAVSQLFTDWVNVRGGAGSIEIKEACNKIELLFESNQHGDRIYEIGKDYGSNQIVRNLLAYKVYDVLTQTLEFLVPVPVFNKEIAEGVDRSELIAKLQERGYLKLSTEDDRNTVKRLILGKRRSFFAFREFWVEEKEEANQNSEKGTGRTGHTGHEPETSSESQPNVSREVSRSKNTNGTHGTLTGHRSIDPGHLIDLCPVCPVDENLTGQLRDTTEPSGGDGLKGTVPCVPCVPLKKHISQTNFKNPALKYQRLLNGNIGTTVIKFEKQPVAKDWKKLIADVFGFYGELEKITDEQSDKYKWKLVFDKFDRDGIDRLQAKDFSQPPQPRS
jgi:putative DNA primase/helicase